MRRLGLAGIAALLAAVPVSAQVQEPAIPDYAGHRQEQPKGQRPRWTFAVGAEESYESNVPYTEVLGQDDFVSRGTGRLEVDFPIRRGVIELAGEGGANVYRTVKGLNRFTWGGAGRLEHRFTRRSQIEAQLRSAHGFARDNPRLDATGALSPLTLTRNDSAEALWREGFGHGFEVRVGGRGERFRFDAPGLQNGWTAGGRLGFENEFSRRFGLGMEGEYARTATEPNTIPTVGSPLVETVGRTFEIERLVATLRYEIVHNLTFGLEGGAARFRSVETAVPVPAATPPATGTGTGTGTGSAPGGTVPAPYQPTITPTAAATLTGVVGKHTITALASRRVEQTYGVGAVGINLMFALSYRLELAKWVAFTLVGSDNHNEAPDATLLSSGRTVTTGFDCALPAQVALRLNYAYWDRQDPGRDWRSHTVAVGIAKRFDWR